MKLFRHIGLLAFAVLCVFTLVSGISQSAEVPLGISKHNLSLSGSSSGFQFNTLQVCVFCHTPHGANSDVRADTIYNGTTQTYEIGSMGPMLLWNRALSNAGTADGNGYITYTSSSMTADNSSVRAYSLMCLSCHDGVGALNVMLNPPADANGGAGGNPSSLGSWTRIGEGHTGDDPLGTNIGDRRLYGIFTDDGQVDLSDDHPISFDYTPQLVSDDNPGGGPGGLRTPSNGGITGPYGTLRLFYSPSTAQNTSLECSTCHNVHDQGKGSTGTYPFLAMSNTNSEMCLNCHNK